jgi:hypothetical protein
MFSDAFDAQVERSQAHVMILRERPGSSGALKLRERLYCAVLAALFLPSLALSATDWALLGSPGTLSQSTTDVAVINNPGGTLDVFLVGPDHAVWHNFQEPSVGGWSGWISLGFPSAPISLLNPIAVGRNSDGRLEVFVAGNDGSVWHSWQQSPGNEGSWTGWNFLCPLPANYLPSSLAVGVNKSGPLDGTLELFTADPFQGVGHIFQDPAIESWSGWINLGVPPRGPKGASIGAITVVRDSANQLNAFVMQDDFSFSNGSNVWFINQIGPGGGYSGWTPLWFNNSTPCCGNFSDPAVGVNANGTLEIFIGAFDGSVWHRWQWAGTQSWFPDWEPLGTPGPSPKTIPIPPPIPAVASNSDGRLEIFATDVVGALWHNFQVADQGSWSGWNSLGIAPGTSGMSPRTAVGVNGDGRLEVFSIAAQTLLHAWQRTPGGTWDSSFVAVPDVNCFSGAMASQTIRDAGLIPQFSPHSSGPDVIQETPLAGTLVKPGSVVVLKLGTCR